MAKIFISHSHKDKQFTEKLSSDLSHSGFQVWLDQWEIAVGDNIPLKLQEGISKANFVVLVLSPNSVQSLWVNKEWSSAFSNEVDLNNVIVLPVLIEQCDIPLFLKTKKYADFTSDYNAGLQELKNAIKSHQNCQDRGGKINAWYLDDNQDYLNRFNERHNNHFAVNSFNNAVELLEGLRKINPDDKNFPDILLVDLYAPLSASEVNPVLLEETNQKLKLFFQMEKKLKGYVDSAWEPYGVEIVNSVREHYSYDDLPIAIYTQRGLVLLEDEFIIELEQLGISWLLKKQFSAETDRLILSKIMMHGKKGMDPGRKRILILDDNPKFIEDFLKRHKKYYDIEGIIDQGELLTTIEKMKLENRFPHVLLVDLYYPRGNDKEALLKIKEANEKLLEFHNFEADLKKLIKKTYEPVGIQVIKAVREMYNESQLPVMIYSQSGLLMLDNSSIQKIANLDTGWLLKDRYSINAEQIKIINQIAKSNKRKESPCLSNLL